MILLTAHCSVVPMIAGNKDMQDLRSVRLRPNGNASYDYPCFLHPHVTKREAGDGFLSAQEAICFDIVIFSRLQDFVISHTSPKNLAPTCSALRIHENSHRPIIIFVPFFKH